MIRIDRRRIGRPPLGWTVDDIRRQRQPRRHKAEKNGYLFEAMNNEGLKKKNRSSASQLFFKGREITFLALKNCVEA